MLKVPKTFFQSFFPETIIVQEVPEGVNSYILNVPKKRGPPLHKGYSDWIQEEVKTASDPPKAQDTQESAKTASDPPEVQGPSDTERAYVKEGSDSNENSSSDSESDPDERLQKKVRIGRCKKRVVVRDGVKQKVTSYSKFQACYYCGKLVSKVSKHLPAHHSKEPEVKEIMDLPTGSKDKRQKLKLITNWGNHNHNKKVLKKGKGDIIVAKRPTEAVSFHHWYPCTCCFAWINRSELWRHVNKCKYKEAGDKMNSTEMVERSKTLLISTTVEDPRLAKLITKIRAGEVLDIIKQDRLIQGNKEQFSV